MPLAWAERNSLQVGPSRRGAGRRPCRRSAEATLVFDNGQMKTAIVLPILAKQQFTKGAPFFLNVRVTAGMWGRHGADGVGFADDQVALVSNRRRS
jgi:hypothetical protein